MRRGRRVHGNVLAVRFAILILSLAFAAPAYAQCADGEPANVVEIGARLVACAGRGDPDATRRAGAFVRSVTATFYSTPGQRVTLLAQAAPLFRERACSDAWREGAVDTIVPACRAAYCANGCAGSDAAAFAALIGAAIERDYHLAPGPTSRWIAAALLPRLGAASWSAPGLVLDHDGDRSSSRWIESGEVIRRPIATRDDRARLLRELPPRPRPLGVAIASASFESTSMLALLIERRFAFRIVAPP